MYRAAHCRWCWVGKVATLKRLGWLARCMWHSADSAPQSSKYVNDGPGNQQLGPHCCELVACSPAQLLCSPALTKLLTSAAGHQHVHLS